MSLESLVGYDLGTERGFPFGGGGGSKKVKLFTDVEETRTVPVLLVLLRERSRAQVSEH